MELVIAPSILAADFGKLHTAIDIVNQSEAEWVHCDVMDGHFVPNISFGMPIIAAVRKLTAKVLDVHLMIEAPERYIQAFKDAGADRLTVHVEACTHLDRTLHQIKDAGMKAGVALNPATSLHTLEHVWPLLDTVLLMTVNPGFGGQSFISYVVSKVAAARQRLLELGMTETHVQVDGGVNHATAAKLVEAGATSLVAGSYVFKAQNPMDSIEGLVQYAHLVK